MYETYEGLLTIVSFQSMIMTTHRAMEDRIGNRDWVKH